MRGDYCAVAPRRPGLLILIVSCLVAIGCILGAAGCTGRHTMAGDTSDDVIFRELTTIVTTAHYNDINSLSYDYARRIHDPARLQRLVAFCEERMRDPFPNGWHHSPWDGAWISCVQCLGETRTREAADMLITMWTTGNRDSMQKEMIVVALSHCGRVAVPSLKKVQGPEEERVRWLIDDINRGTEY